MHEPVATLLLEAVPLHICCPPRAEARIGMVAASATLVEAVRTTNILKLGSKYWNDEEQGAIICGRGACGRDVVTLHRTP